MPTNLGRTPVHMLERGFYGRFLDGLVFTFFSAAAPLLFLLWLSSHKVLLSATLISKRAKVRKIVVHTQSWVSRTLYNSSKQFSPFSSRTHVREHRIEAILHQIHFFNWKSTESVLKTLNMKQAEKTAPMD